MLTIAYNAQFCPKRNKGRAAHVAAFTRLAALRPVAVGVNEAGGYRRELAHVPGYRAIQPHGYAGKNALLIRDDVTVHATGVHKLHGRKFVGRDVAGARHTGITSARAILWALVTDPDTGSLVYVATWHTVPSQSHSKRARALLAAEAATAAAWIRSLTHPVDLMGDTNGAPTLPLFAPLRTVASPAFAVSRDGAPIDGHWIAGGTGKATALDGYPSDHKPVVADIAWLPPKPAPAPQPEAPVTETRAVDYSTARPGPDLIKTKGYVGVGRYIALGSSSKLLGAAEAKQLRAAGLKVWLVAEGVADRATAGEAAGQSDARAAAAAAAAIGYPGTAPLFAAVDFDANPAQVTPYLHGWHAVLGNRAGVYGGIRVIDALAGVIPWLWQTTAWSGGKLSPHAHIYQRVTMHNPIPGCDENVICRPIPVWGGVLAPPGTPADFQPPAKPKPGKRRRPFNERAAIAAVRKVIANAKTAARKARYQHILGLLTGRKKK